MMNQALSPVLLAVSFLLSPALDRARADDSESPGQLSLADLAAYRLALAGKATADNARAADPPELVTFKDLWTRTDAFRGRRVSVDGRVERIFRQGPVGNFPALAEIWITSPAGDPFCLISPPASTAATLAAHEHAATTDRFSTQSTQTGQEVRFTGTFLKMVRYAAADGGRLAPLVVGSQPPVAAQKTAQAKSPGRPQGDRFFKWVGSPAAWLLCFTLAFITAGGLAWWHLHLPPAGPSRRKRGRPTTTSREAEPPLKFIEPHG
jgi:hypothetical protein